MDHGAVLPNTRRVNIELWEEEPDQENMNVNEGVHWPKISWFSCTSQAQHHRDFHVSLMNESLKTFVVTAA